MNLIKSTHLHTYSKANGVQNYPTQHWGDCPAGHSVCQATIGNATRNITDATTSTVITQNLIGKSHLHVAVKRNFSTSLSPTCVIQADPYACPSGHTMCKFGADYIRNFYALLVTPLSNENINSSKFISTNLIKHIEHTHTIPDASTSVTKDLSVMLGDIQPCPLGHPDCQWSPPFEYVAIYFIKTFSTSDAITSSEVN